MVARTRPETIGVFIDAQNLNTAVKKLTAGKYQLDFHRLASYLRSYGKKVEIYYYTIDFTVVCAQPASQIQRDAAQRWRDALRAMEAAGFQLRVKPARRVSCQKEGGSKIKGDHDVNIAGDIGLMVGAHELSQVILMSGDHDFAHLLRKIGNGRYGVRSTVICQGWSARELKEAATTYVPLERIFPRILRECRSH